MKLTDYVKAIPGLDSGKLLCALSGGADSTALLHMLCTLGYEVHAAHVNYGLRGTESDQDEAFCRELCRELHIPLHVHKAGSARSGNTQQWARDIRYRFFEALDREQNYSHILTAHQADDAFESMLMNLAADCGPAGFLGISSRNGKYLRPLLGCTRSDTEAYCAAQRLAFRNDSSNAKDVYTRNRIRHHISPQFGELNAAAMEHFAGSRQRLEKALAFYYDAYRNFLEQEVKTGRDQETVELTAENGVFCAEWLAGKGFKAATVREITGLRQQGEWHSRGGRVLLHGGQLVFRASKETPAAGNSLLLPDQEGLYHYGDIRVSVSFTDTDSGPDYSLPDTLYADAGALRFPLLLRAVEKGDRMQPFGMKGRKKISDILTDKKVNRFDKEKALVLCSEGEIIWLCGVTGSEKTRIGPGTRRVLCVRLSRV